MRRIVLGLAALGAGAAGVMGALAACNVKIDASVLDDAGSDAFALSVIACHAPGDCKSADPCVTARCDDGTQQCAFDVCPTGDQCSAASCTTVNKCGQASGFGFHAGSFPIAEGLGCPSCVGAVFPFVFVATNLQVRAFRVSDPTNSTPPEVPVTRLGFAPRTVLTSGRRVYFVGGPNGASQSPFQLQVAWIDVPADPGVKSMRAHEATYPYPSTDFRFDGVVAGDGDQLFSLHRVQTYEMNATVFRDEELLMHVQPNQDPGQLNFFAPTNYPANGHTVGFANGRLVVYRTNPGTGTPPGPGVGAFSFDSTPGQNGATNIGEQAVPDMGSPGASTFAQTSDGAIYWATALRNPPVANQTQAIGGVRLALPLPDGGGTFSVPSRIDLEKYDTGLPETNGQPNPNPYVGPIAPLGTGAALALAAAKENPAQTSVQLVTRNGATLALAAGKRFLVPARVDQVAVGGTTGFGYVVNPDTANTMTVHIFSASCQ
jgi:hypothetical protein